MGQPNRPALSSPEEDRHPPPPAPQPDCLLTVPPPEGIWVYASLPSLSFLSYKAFLPLFLYHRSNNLLVHMTLGPFCHAFCFPAGFAGTSVRKKEVQGRNNLSGVQIGKQCSENGGHLNRLQCPSESDLELEKDIISFPNLPFPLRPTSYQGHIPK